MNDLSVFQLILLSLIFAIGYTRAATTTTQKYDPQNVAPYVTEKNLIRFIRVTRSNSYPTDQAIKDAFVLANPNLPVTISFVSVNTLSNNGEALVKVESPQWEGHFLVKIRDAPVEAESQGPTGKWMFVCKCEVLKY